MNSLINLVTIREFQKADVNFILDSFINCLSQYTESMFKGWNRKESCTHLEQIILFAITKLNYSIWIAVNKDDDQSILGYLIADPSNNHIFFNYTKNVFRKLGIQSNFLLPLAIDFSQPVTVNWQTKEALKLQKIGKISIRNVFLEQLMESQI